MGNLLYWPLACLLMASGQGLLMPAIRRTPPGPEARRQDVALHGLLMVAYFLPLSLQLVTYSLQLITTSCIAAVLNRLLLFDPVLNLASGAHAFAVGSTARFDKVLRWLAAQFGWPSERVRLIVWLLSLLASSTYYFFLL